MRTTFLICLGVFLFGGGILSFGETSFYGEFTSSFTAAIPDDGEYESIVNQGNFLELQDLSLSNSLVAKLNGRDEDTSFEVWFTLNQYPLGQSLLAAAGTDFMAVVYVNELNTLMGDSIYTLDLQRAQVEWLWLENLRFRLGRQSMLTGYGYGWNPMDFANSLKDPTDPEAELKGIDALTIHLFPFSIANLKLYGLVDAGMSYSGLAYEDLLLGGEFSLSLPLLEAKVTALYDRDKEKGEDSRVSAVGLGFMADLWGLGFYGEGALLDGGRTPVPDGTLGLERPSALLFNGLVGLEYTFTTEWMLVLEYFYNAEGFSKEDRENYQLDFETVGPSSAYFLLYRPGYFSQHYVLLNILIPNYEWSADVQLTSIFSPDSGALALLPGITWNVSGSFSVGLNYGGFVSLYEDAYNEVELAPIKHSFKVEGKYNF